MYVQEKYTIMRISRFIIAGLLFTSFAVMSAFRPAAAQTTDFRAKAGALIEKGELKKAVKLVDGLPKKVRESNAFAIDSIRKVTERIRRDFSVTPSAGRAQLEKSLGYAVSNEKLNSWKRKRYIEVDTIDGKEMWFRRAVSNLRLIDVEDFKPDAPASADPKTNRYARFYQEAMATEPHGNNLRDPHRWQLTFTITVNANAVPDGDTLRVWMPFPVESERQSDVKLIKSSAPVTLSQGTYHHTAYMEGVAQKGKPTHFSMTFSYIAYEQHFTRAEIMANLKPYDTSSALYREYTAEQYPHIIKSKKMIDLAHRIVGNERNPVLQASMVYDWIATNFPWAGAREYSTIANIPEYVLKNRHGDCGQVSLLYITLMRCLGVPARWESGFSLTPGTENYHDWTETYFEGTGWVPTDVSHGRSFVGGDFGDYYKTGIDIYRFAANKGVNGEFYPKKNFIRCETVDNQAGEVEWRGGNLEYTDWDSSLHVDSCVKILLDRPEKPWALAKLSVVNMRVKPSLSSGMATQAIMGMPMRVLSKAGSWYKLQTPEGYESYAPGNGVVLLDSAQLNRWKKSRRYIVTVYQSRLTTEPGGDNTVSDLLLGDILESQGDKDGYVLLATPDGRKGYVSSSNVEELSSWASRNLDLTKVISTAKRMMGSPYLWGGTSTKMTDCSGLMKVSYFSSGVILKRDAWQQALTGQRIEASEWHNAEPGDLLFFSGGGDRVSHVGMYLGDGKYIHCSGRVRVNSLDSKASDYLPNRFLSISRINGHVGEEGITYVRNHPWYF